MAVVYAIMYHIMGVAGSFASLIHHALAFTGRKNWLYYLFTGIRMDS